MEVFLAIIVFGLIVWGLSAVAKSDAKHEQEIQKQIYEKQVQLWAMQARMGQEVTVEKDLERIYGLDKAKQKQERKEIIKGAVAGGIIAGDAGAVVGAMVAKNKIDNNRTQNNSSYSPTYTTYGSNYQSQYSPSVNHSEGIELDDDLIELLVFEREACLKEDGLRDISKDVEEIRHRITGELKEDCLTAVQCLKTATVTDVMMLLCEAKEDYLEWLTNQKVSGRLRQLWEEGAVVRFEVKRRMYYADI